MDLRKVDALLTMLKQLDDQESAGFLMGAGNQVSQRLDLMERVTTVWEG